MDKQNAVTMESMHSIIDERFWAENIISIIICYVEICSLESFKLQQ